MFRLALKGVKHNPKRLILTLVAVVLGVMLVTTIHTFTHAIDKSFTDNFSAEIDGPEILIASEASTDYTYDRPAFEEAVLDDVRAVDGLGEAVGTVEAAGLVLTSDAAPPVPSYSSSFQVYSTLDGFVTEQVTEGTAPTSAGEIVMGSTAAESLGYAVGDTVYVSTNAGLVELALVGTYEAGAPDPFGANLALVYTTLDGVRAIGGFDGGFTNIYAYTANGADARAVSDAVNDILPRNVVSISAIEKADNELAAIRDGLKVVDWLVLAFALIAVYVAAFIIANTFRILVTQRTREIGLLRAIGSRGSDILKQFMLESVIIATVALGIGLALGYGLAALLMVLFSSINPDVILTLPSLPIDAVLWAVGVAYIVTMVSALLPAIHASHISPMDALRESSTQIRKPLKQRNIVGGAATALGITGIVLGLWASVPSPITWIAIGAVAVIQGVTLLSAQVLVPLARSLRKPLSSVFGVDGKLAAGNVEREPRRAGTTAAALMIGVMLLALVATFTDSTKALLKDQVAGQASSDFIVSSDFFEGPPAPISVQAIESMRGAEGVALVAPIAVTSVYLDGEKYDVGAVDIAIADETFNYDATPPVSEAGEGVYIGPEIQRLGYVVGDFITLEGATATVDMEVTGLYNLEDQAVLFMDMTPALALDENLVVIQALVNAESGTDLDTVQASLNDSLTEWPRLEATTPNELVSRLFGFIDGLLVFISIMLTASLIVAILGVANTLLLSVMERTREVGLLRAVGARRKSIWRMITLESVAIAVFGAVLGIVLGVSFGAAIVTALKDTVGFESVSIPWAWMGIYTAIAIGAGIVAAIWPAWRASRLNILDAIAHDG